MATSSPAALAQAAAAIDQSTGGFWSTRNTDLAACIGALRVPIRQFRRIREHGQSDASAVTHYFFDGADATQTVSAAVLGWQWGHRAQHEAAHPQGDPFTWMRRGIEALKWIMGAHHGTIRFRPTVAFGAFFKTDDWHLAACLKAVDYQVLRLGEKVVTLNVLEGDPILIRIQEDFAQFNDPAGPAAWMHRAFKVRAELIRAAKSSAKGGHLRTETRHVKGDPLRGGKELYLYDEPAPGENRAEFERLRREAMRIFHS